MIFGRKSKEPEVGFTVLTNDEEGLGDIAAVHGDHLDVQGGTLDHRQAWRVPREAISKIDDQMIHLNVSRGQVMAKGWTLTMPHGDDSAPTLTT